MSKTLINFTILLTAFLMFASGLTAQSRVPENPFGFVMNKPEGWVPIGKDEVELSLKRLDLKETTLDRFLEQNQGTLPIFTYVRYKQDTFNGVNPKIEARVIRIKTNAQVTFTAFKPAAENALRGIAKEFDDQKYIVAPSEVVVGGVHSVYHVSEFTIKMKSGSKHRVRSRTYMVPRGTFFLQISFVDEPAVSDLSSEFDRLVGSINFSK